jgi:hypothetical protein
MKASEINQIVGQPILAAAGFKPALAEKFISRESRLKGGRRQDCLPHGH